jgi:predicted transcriptional regulator
MPRKKTPTLTEAEYRLMDIVWTNGPLSVAEVVARIGEPPLAYNTVLTTLRILEQKGYLSHKASGRAFIYSANVERDEAQRDVVNHVVARFFGGSPRELVLNLLETELVDETELARLRELIDRKTGPE